LFSNVLAETFERQLGDVVNCEDDCENSDIDVVCLVMHKCFSTFTLLEFQYRYMFTLLTSLGKILCHGQW